MVRSTDSTRKQDSMLRTLRGWDGQVVGVSGGGVHKVGQRGHLQYSPNLLRLRYTNFLSIMLPDSGA